jgi:DNA-binding transcriptional LysR family regulator
LDRFAALETFVNVFEAGSFSAAAQRLHVGQPAVSKAIAQLEAQLGVRLLLRSTRGLKPTEAGKNFYEHAKQALAEAEAAELAARGARAGLSGRLRVCAALTFARLHIVPRLRSFLDAHPQLEVELILDDRNIDLLEEGIDVALRMGTLADSGMSARRIDKAPRIVVATPEYLAAHKTPRVPQDLSKLEAVIYNRGGGGATWTFSRGTAKAEVELQGRLHIGAAEGVRAAVLAHMGIAVASQWMFEPELRDGTVKQVLADWSLPAVDLWAVYPAGRLASAKARAFVAFVENILATPPGAE